MMKAARIYQQAYHLTPPCSIRQTRTFASRNTNNRYSQSRAPPPISLLSRNFQRTSVRHLVKRRFSSTKSPFPSTPNVQHESPLSLSQRLKKLSREYGWSAFGVYLALTALDFPFCFLAVRWIGTERIGHWEHVIMERIWTIIPYSLSSLDGAQESETDTPGKKLKEYGVPSKSEEVGVPGYDHGVAEAEKRNQSEDASMEALYTIAN